MPLILITPPTDEPVTLAEVKNHLRIDSNDFDSDLLGFMIVAREWVEGETNRALVSQEWEYSFDCFPEEIQIPKGPLISITSITYIDTSGASQVMDAADYIVDSRGVPGRVVTAFGVCWPSVRRQPNAVIVRFVCGYADRLAVPFRAKQAIKEIVGHLDCHRESTTTLKVSELPMGVDRLLGPLVIPRPEVYE